MTSQPATKHQTRARTVSLFQFALVMLFMILLKLYRFVAPNLSVTHWFIYTKCTKYNFVRLSTSPSDWLTQLSHGSRCISLLFDFFLHFIPELSMRGGKLENLDHRIFREANPTEEFAHAIKIFSHSCSGLKNLYYLCLCICVAVGNVGENIVRCV